MSSMSRRGFLGIGAAAAAGVNVASARDDEKAAYRVDDQQPFNGQTRRLKLMRGDRYIASLIFATDYPTHFRLKPELLPVCTPAGVPVTDSHQYCFIHHQSISTGHGKVLVDGEDREVDFYRKLPFPDEQREDRFHTGKNLFHIGPSGIQHITDAKWTIGDHIRIDLRLEWQTRVWHQETGRTLLIEQRRYDIRQRNNATLIDQLSVMTPADRPITMIAERHHSLNGVRVHDLIDVEDGGTMIDSEGRVNPDGNYWDAEGDHCVPRWVDCTGRIGPATAGVTLISHPANVRNQWYVREFGLMIVSPMQNTAVRITHEQPLRFATRYVAHDDQPNVDQIESWHREFADQKV